MFNHIDFKVGQRKGTMTKEFNVVTSFGDGM